ncbi:MAG: excinuclease ABC subunit UvrC [Holosporales bacterium]|jgi:excinuclease ABC subunit C|nr:excinuclease ABC subunit UvrC [Holosporales bacterium]
MFTTTAFSFDGYAVFQHSTHLFPSQPGVYRMLSKDKEILYVGKAKNLRKRLQNYAQFETLTLRIQRLVALISQVVTTTTQTETEALLLESSLIREHKPRFNILLKDDKSFPSLLITKHPFPRLVKYRGSSPQTGTSFGPFLASNAVDMMIEETAKAFKIRTCSDVFFANRHRPCLRFDIKRCSGACTHRISNDAYQENVQAVMDILKGKSQALQHQLEAKMQHAAEELHYEAAAGYRDQIQAISKILTHQEIYRAGFGDLDIIVLARSAETTGLFITTYRQDCFKREHVYLFDKNKEIFHAEDILPLLINLYKITPSPERLLTSDIPIESIPHLAQALSTLAGHAVEILIPQRGEKAHALERAKERAQNALEEKTQSVAFTPELWTNLARIFHLSRIPQCIEVYDNSHLHGQFPYGVKIVATREGFQPKRYRRFPIPTGFFSTQDDFAMLEATLKHRFHHIDTDPIPDLLLIDGGKGQLSVTLHAIAALPIRPEVIAIAKGPERNAGKEQFFLAGNREIDGTTLDKSLLFFLERLRDEAHRFAITSHRRARTKNVRSSKLDDIPGIGAHRKRMLLRYFGSLKVLQAASLEDIARVTGIGAKQAKIIWEYLHA